MIELMEITHAQLQTIGEFVKSHLEEWLAEKYRPSYDPALAERIVRVEEELKHQREIILTGFKHMDERLEAVDKRFEAVDKRFEDVNKRFDDVNKRFDDVNKRFEDMDKRFESMDKRFELMDKRFESMDKRFDLLTKRIDRFMVWSFGMFCTIATITISITFSH